MDISSDSQILLKKVYGFHRLTMTDSDETIKTSIQEILHLWPEILAAGEQATDDELFTLNVSRAVLTQVFTIVLSKDFFNKDHSLVREIFFTCFNMLVNYANIFQNNNSIYIDSNIRLLLKMISSITSSVQFQHNDLSNNGDQQLLIAMREHIDEDSNHDNLTDGIISFIWNLSDQTILIPILLNAGYANSIVQWIKSREMKFRDEKVNAPIHILHNISRHDDGIDELNTYDALKVIDEVKTESTDGDDMTIHIAMIRALLTDINQIQSDATKYSNKIVEKLVQISLDATKTDRYRYNGTHVSEPLTVLVKLFYNDELLDNILSNNKTNSSLTLQSIIELFVSLLTKFYPKINVDNNFLEKYTCVVVFNLFWLISNHEKYGQIIRDHQQLMDIINNAALDEQSYIDTCMPRTMKGIQQAANDILQNLASKN